MDDQLSKVVSLSDGIVVAIGHVRLVGEIDETLMGIFIHLQELFKYGQATGPGIEDPDRKGGLAAASRQSEERKNKKGAEESFHLIRKTRLSTQK